MKNKTMCLKWLTAVLSFLFVVFTTETIFADDEVDVPRPIETKELKQSEASLRSRQVEQVNYDLHLDFTQTKVFSGHTKLSFKLRPEAAAVSPTLFIDLVSADIVELLANGKTVAFNYDQNRIVFKVSDLMVAAGSSSIELSIKYKRKYNNNGQGLHKLIDPEDHATYLYTQMEPNAEREVFPSFAQPDLKAEFKLEVRAPKSWVVANNTDPLSQVESGDAKVWSFAKSQTMSTYPFAITAGPYHIWRDTAGKYPLELMARKSVAQYINVEEWFKVTRLTIDLLEKAFNVQYPFKGVIRQAIVPEFNAGAMENVNLVTYSERLVQRVKPTPGQRADLFNTIAHELVHMWFGDLVTMVWWDDLWLNESFADFISYWVLDKLQKDLDLDPPWIRFYQDRKNWGYSEDEMPTTHPIVGDVGDTEEAESIFDGITYSKGAAALKQLMSLIGEPRFFQGANLYFRGHAYGNATRTDFFNAIGNAANRNLEVWENEWLKTSGTNTVSAEVTVTGGKIQTLQLVQGVDPYTRIYRTHFTNVGLLYLENGKLILKKTIPVEYKGAKTEVTAAHGEKAPDFTFVGVNDPDFVKVKLGDISILKTHLSDIEDDFVRSMVWNELGHMVSDGLLSTQDYLDLAFAHLAKEKSVAVSFSVAARMNSYARNYLIDDAQSKLKSEYKAKLEAFYLRQLDKAEANDPKKLSWFSNLMSVAHSQPVLDRIVKWLSGQETLPGIEIKAEFRWRLIRVLARNNSPLAKELMNRERDQDRSSMGELEAISTELSFQDVSTRKQWFDRIVNEKELSLAKKRQAMAIFACEDVAQLRAETDAQFFAILPKIVKDEEGEFPKAFAGAMFPTSLGEAAISGVDSYLQANPKTPAGVKKALIQNQYGLRKQLAAQKKSKAHLNAPLNECESALTR